MTSPKRMISLRSLTMKLAVLAISPFALAQLPPVNETHVFSTSSTYDAPTRQNVTTNTTYQIDDDVVVTVSNADNGPPGTAAGFGGVYNIGSSKSFTIAPSGTTGRIVFANNHIPTNVGNSTANGQGGVFFVGSSATLDITNASFLGNWATANIGGGVIRTSSNSATTKLTNVLFDGNFAPTGGAIRAYQGLDITSGTFIGNYAHGGTAGNAAQIAATGIGGALSLFSATTVNATNVEQDIIRESYFANNWASKRGGAIGSENLHSVTFWDHAGFENNFAGLNGGAFYDTTNTSDALVDGHRFVFTGTTSVTDYVYSGNIARGVELTADEITAARNGTFVFTDAASAKAGGFYFSEAANTKLKFEIADNVTVSIGKAVNSSAWDSFATADATGASAKIELTGTGAGKLILHADNSYFQGAVNVNTGTLLLGNQNAKLGGVITVADGATFGGAGELITHRQNDTVFAGRSSLTIGNNARVQVGTDTAVDAETLTVAGNLTAGTGVTFTHDLFTSGAASLLRVENLDLAGPATINLGLLATGQFALMEWSGSGLGASDLSNLTLTVDGLTSNPRSNAALSLSGNQLVVTNTVNNLVMRWTGAEGGNWTRRPSSAQRNWADVGGSAENRFFNADTVVFDGVADAANAANRDITIEAGGVVVSDMEVSGTERYVFRGTGGIEADAAAVGNATFTPTGKLKKSGSGELVFANTGANVFQGGIEIAGGTIAFDHAAQLGTGGASGITFTDTATLRASGTVTGTLTGGVSIAAGKTATLEVESGGSLVYDGGLAAAADATLSKTGAGSLLLAGDSSTNAGAFAVDAGTVVLAETATLGGKITVASDAALGGVGLAGAGGSVKVAAGGILEAGLGSGQSGTLTVNNLEMTGDAVLRLDLFKDADTGGYQKSDRVLDSGASAISGVNVIDLATFASGTFNLGNLTGLAASGRVTLSGMTLPSGGRLSAELTDASGTLELVTTSDQSRVMTWTGNSGSIWNLAEADWTDSGAVNQFSYGDRVIFDGGSDAAHPENRNIFIDGGVVRVADMTVSGGADYTFTGGAIHAGADNVQADAGGIEHITDATGKLVKTGSGTLTLANTQNTFLGGVEIGGGTLAFSRADQLATSDSTGITFAGDGALRAAGDLALDDTIVVAPGVTGTIDSAGYTLALGGTLTGTEDATLAKAGAGAVVFGADASGFSGTLAVRGGVVRAGAANVFTAASDATIAVDAGATLDLDGHDQTLAKLQGAGTVELGAAKLTMVIGDGGAEFAGGFAGSGSVVKKGPGKWTLSGASRHTGGTILEDGGLGLAHSAALGSGPLTVAMPAATLSVEADGLNIGNEIAAGSSALTLETNGHGAEFSGNITASTLALEGTGTLALSGNNTLGSLAINIPLAIARRAESIGSTPVSIGAGSTLEFREVGMGQVRGNLSGGRVLITSSTLSLSGANDLRALDIATGSRVTAASTGALGGVNADITVRDGAWLMLPILGTTGGNMRVDGGTLVFGSAPASGSSVLFGTPGSLALAGTLDFSNGGEIRLGGLLPTGIYTAAIAYGGITGAPSYDPHQGGMFMVADIVDDDTLQITAYNKALEPGKDIVVGFDAMAATTRAVSAHLSEEFITPLTGKRAQRGENSLWFRAIGSYQEYGDDQEHLGYTDNTYAGIVGYDWISTEALMLGGYLGHSSTSLETTNNATTEMELPYLGLYAARRLGMFFVSADVTAGFGSADTERQEDLGNVVTGSYKFDTLGGAFDLGCVLPLFANGEVRPSVGLHYMDLSFHDYAETGKGAVRLDDLQASQLQGVVRIDASKAITLPWKLPGMVGLGLGWRQSIRNERTEAWATLVGYPDARIQIRGDEYDENSVTTGLNVRMMLSRSMLFSLAYDYDSVPFGDENSGTGRHTFNSVLRISW